MPGTDLAPYTPEQHQILELLGLPPNHAHSKALLLLADRYGLDPLLKEIVVIPGRGPFVGVKGAVGIALRSGLLDGIEADDQWESDTHWNVRCIVWRKDMAHPAAKVIGRVAKTEKKDWPLEIARARAVRAALGYAFNIHDDYGDDTETWAPPPDETAEATVITTSEPPTPPGEVKRKGGRARTGARGDEEHRGSAPSAAPPGPPADPFDALPPLPSDNDPNPTRTIVVGGHSLAEKLAIAAKAAGIDDDPTRHDVIYAATAGTAQRGQEVTGDTAQRCFEAFAGLADGTVELRYKPDGTPTLIRPRRRQPAPQDDF